ncbi:MAG: hypothetical protein J7M25_10535 [Deltaproteobacteria bacterium]|nr:hypothetical protein [Deltaproteobacteria bacterium]
MDGPDSTWYFLLGGASVGIFAAVVRNVGWFGLMASADSKLTDVAWVIWS